MAISNPNDFGDFSGNFGGAPGSFGGIPGLADVMGFAATNSFQGRAVSALNSATFNNASGTP